MSIFRTVHDRANPYCVLNKKSLWDENLSLNAVAIWARLMSRPDNWVVNIKELSNSCKKNKQTIYKIVNELIENGYAYRHQFKVDGKYSRVEYMIFERKMTPEEIQEILPLTNFSYTEPWVPTERPILSTKSTVLSKEDKPEPIQGAKGASSPSPSALEISISLLEAIKKTKPDLKKPSMSQWANIVDKMLRIDKRSPDAIKRVLDALPGMDFWCDKILSAKNLREKFDRLELKISEKNRKPESKVQTNREKAELVINNFGHRAHEKKKRIVLNNDSIEFQESGSITKIIYFSESGPDFDWQVDRHLKYWGLMV